MMQINEIQQRFSSAEQSIQQAVQACSKGKNISPELQDCITQLKTQAGQAKQELGSLNPVRIMQYIDQLEQLGDRAKTEAQQASNLDDSVRNAVVQAHDQLSSLKHQLH